MLMELSSYRYVWMLICTENAYHAMIEILPAHKIMYFRFKNRMCKVLNSTAITSGYAGRDPQGGTSDGSILISSLICYKE